MVEVIIGYILVIVITVALASVVAAQAWHHLPARMFALFAVALVLINTVNILQEVSGDAPLNLILRRFDIVLTGIAATTMHLLIASLFAPEWWQARRPIIWITLPYIVVLLALSLDLIFQSGIFLTTIVSGTLQGGELAARLTPIGYALLTLFLIGSTLPIVVLITAFVRKPHNRRLIGILVGTFVAALLCSSVPGLLRLPSSWTGIVLVALLIIGPAYVVLRSDLLIPLRVASDLALRSMHDAVVVEGQDGLVLFANSAAVALGVKEGRSLRLTMQAIGIDPAVLQAITLANNQGQPSEHSLMIADRQLELIVTPILARYGDSQATLIIGRDVTETNHYTAQIEQERTRLDTVVHQLTARERERDQLTATIQSLALPLIPVYEGVLVLPVVGSFDHLRQGELAEVLLRGIEREHARLVLIDITGLHLLDTSGAKALLEAVNAARLLGARCVLAGVRPEIAQALVSLGVTFGDLRTSATLQQALQDELYNIAQH